MAPDDSLDLTCRDLPCLAKPGHAAPRLATNPLTLLNLLNFKTSIKAIVSWTESPDPDKLSCLFKMLSENRYRDCFVQNMKGHIAFPLVNHREALIDSLSTSPHSITRNEEPFP